MLFGNELQRFLNHHYHLEQIDWDWFRRRRHRHLHRLQKYQLHHLLQGLEKLGMDWGCLYHQQHRHQNHQHHLRCIHLHLHHQHKLLELLDRKQV